jgi:hypothetical protein
MAVNPKQEMPEVCFSGDKSTTSHAIRDWQSCAAAGNGAIRAHPRFTCVRKQGCNAHLR